MAPGPNAQVGPRAPSGIYYHPVAHAGPASARRPKWTKGLKAPQLPCLSISGPALCLAQRRPSINVSCLKPTDPEVIKVESDGDPSPDGGKEDEEDGAGIYKVIIFNFSITQWVCFSPKRSLIFLPPSPQKAQLQFNIARK